MEIVCKKCAYKWNYKGKAKRISCSKCKTSITVYKHESDNTVMVDEFIPIKGLKFPLSLWKDVRLAQRMQHLPSTGETYIMLKADKEGVLSL